MGEKASARGNYGKTLVELGKSDPNLIVLDADLSGSTRTSFFADAHPDRFFNVGIAEQNMMGIAAGLAVSGKTVFVSTFSMFATARALDHVRNLLAYNELNVKIAATHGGITVGEDGASHQANEDVAMLRVLPNMRVIVPADANEAKEVTRYAHATPGSFFIRMTRMDAPTLDNKPAFVFGKGQILREGSDVAVIACGLMVEQAVLAADMLAKDGIDVTVVNMPTIKPIDEELILSLAGKVKAFVTAEEHSVYGGLGSAVAEVLTEKKPMKLGRVGIKDRFGQSGSPGDLLKEYGLTAADIAAKVKEVL
jgi:transketolase